MAPLPSPLPLHPISGPLPGNGVTHPPNPLLRPVPNSDPLVERLRSLLANPGGPEQPMQAPAPWYPGIVHAAAGYRPADMQRSLGNMTDAASVWEQHHPGAVGRYQIPGWVSRALAHGGNTAA